MTREEFDEYRRALLEEAEGVWQSKNADYASPADVFTNLRKAGGGRVPAHQVTWIFLSKQLAAVERRVWDGETESEPFRSRIVDSINFLTALAALVDEAQGNGIE